MLLRAWDRVATAPVSRRFSPRTTIMRRVESYSRRAQHKSCPTAHQPEPVFQQVLIDEPTPERPARRQKVAAQLPNEVEPELLGVCGKPLETSEVQALVAQAESMSTPLHCQGLSLTFSIATVLDRYLHHPSLNLLRDVRDARQGKLRQVSGTKRWRDDEDAQRRRPGSFSLKLYRRLTPLLADSWTKLGLVSKETAAAAMTSRVNNKPRRDPRRRLANEGVPELSMIGDTTEPDSSRDLVVPPVTTAESISPLKRKARLDLHLENAQDRFRSKMVKLDPIASSVSDTASPTKSPLPSTPHEKDTRGDMEQGVASAGRAFSERLLPSGGLDTDVKTFKAPSYCDTTTIDTDDMYEGIDDTESPVRRPRGPTPSRWQRLAPTTPLPNAATLPSTPGSKIMNADVQNLMDSIPRSVDGPVSTPNHWEREPRSFHFDSQLGNDSSDRTKSQVTFKGHLHPAESTGSRRAQRLVESKRRKSEPLVQLHLKKLQQARRQSASPSKLFPLAEEEPLVYSSPSHPAMTPSYLADTPVPTTKQSAQALPGQSRDNDVTAPLPSFFKNRSPIKGLRNATTPFHDRNTYDIDVRHNLDIFGAMTPTKVQKKAATTDADSKKESVQQLADMVEDQCDGNANVMVMEENGKFIVRFKLPIEFAAMFPQSQGHDESHFTTSPSAISSSPRLSFAGYRAPTTALAQANFTATMPGNTELDQTEDLSQSEQLSDGLTASHASPTKGSPSSPFVRPTITVSEFPEDKTLIVGDFDVTAAVQTPAGPRQSNIDSASASSPAGFDTPTAQTITTEMHGELSSSIISEPSFEPTFQTPTHGHLNFTPTRNSTIEQQPTPQLQREPPSSARTPQFLHHDAALGDQTLIVGDFDATFGQPVQTPTGLAMSTPEPPSPNSLVGLDTPTGQQTMRDEPAASSPISDLDFEPTFQTPTHGHLDFAPENTSPAESPSAEQSQPGKTQQELSPQTPAATKRASPQLTTSFTPVNKPTPQQVSTPVATQSTSAPRNSSASKAAQTASAEAVRTRERQHDDDSPGRAFMRDFIKRSAKPKRPSTTDTGSPIAHTSARPPLGAKSPNMGSDSPEKNKRKRQADDQESGGKPGKEPSPKKPRKEARSGKLSQKGEKTAAAAKKAAVGDPSAEANVRRSSRLNTKEVKSALPTAIKLGRVSAKDTRPILNSAVRNEQAELTRQTNLNTRRNRGNAESVPQILARVSSSEASGDDDADELSNEPVVSKGGKAVTWKTPIAAHQVEKPKRGRPAQTISATPAANSKATKAEKVARIEKTVPTPKSSRPSRIAKPAGKSLGRTNNGTPAKRVTRSRACKDE